MRASQQALDLKRRFKAAKLYTTPMEEELFRILGSVPSESLYVRPFNQPKEDMSIETARVAVLDRIVPRKDSSRDRPRTLTTQVKFAYGRLRNWPMGVYNYYKSTWAIPGTVAHVDPYSEYIMRRVSRVAVCRPALCAMFSSDPLSHVQAGLIALRRSRCDSHKWCPWCHARRIQHKFTSSLPGLYYLVKGFEEKPVTLVTMQVYNENVMDLRSRLHRRLSRTLKPDAHWILSRLNFAKTITEERPVFDLNTLIVDDNRFSIDDLKVNGVHARKPVIRHNRASVAAYKLIPMFYPFQAGILLPEKYMHLDTFLREGGLVNHETGISRGTVDVTFNIPKGYCPAPRIVRKT